MRIISGKYKGKRITAPKKLPIRPTTDMAKEALFNILNNRFFFPEISVLDLFSGSGNITYEFISRGTTNLTAVDAHFKCVQFITETAKSLETEVNGVKSDVFKFLETTKTSFDFIFADPPYDFDEATFLKIPDLIFQNQLLTPDGLLIVEHAKHMSLENHPQFTEARRYGSSVFSFFEVK